MLNTKLAPVLVMVGVAALTTWGCGDDPQSSGTGGRGSGGSSGKGGSAGSAGKSIGGAGGSAGGSAGKGGNGGTSGKAGAGGVGGSSGNGGTSGKGGTGGSSGKGGAGGTSAGQGGEGGDGPGGAGGEGGAGNPSPLEIACAATCADQTGIVACQPDCYGWCTFVGGEDGSEYQAEYLDLVQCQAQKLGPSDYECHEQPSFPLADDWAGIAVGGACQSELCTWTCLDVTYIDEVAYIDCNC